MNNIEPTTTPDGAGTSETPQPIQTASGGQGITVVNPAYQRRKDADAADPAPGRMQNADGKSLETHKAEESEKRTSEFTSAVIRAAMNFPEPSEDEMRDIRKFAATYGFTHTVAVIGAFAEDTAVHAQRRGNISEGLRLLQVNKALRDAIPNLSAAEVGA